MTNLPPLRVGIACYPTFGGSGVLATELGIALANRGHQVHFLAYANPPRLTPSPNITVHRVEVSAYPLFKYPPYDLALTSKMREVMCGAGLDVLHAHYAIPHALCAYLARQMMPSCGTKIVTTLHGTDITVVGSDPSYREVTRFGIQQSDRVIAVSEYLADETRKLFAIQRPIDVVPNFVDTDRFRPGTKSVGAPFVVVHVSNFRPVKRPRDVMLAFARLRRDIPARLRLVGDGPELPVCLSMARELGIAHDVDHIGNILNVEDVLGDADLLLQPSGSEAFGLAALEAMACAVPVVGFRVGGLPEVVIDGETGFLCRFQDVDGLVERSRQILTSPELRHRLGANGRQRALDLFRVEHCVEVHERLYREVLASG